MERMSLTASAQTAAERFTPRPFLVLDGEVVRFEARLLDRNAVHPRVLHQKSQELWYVIGGGQLEAETP